MKIWTKCVLDSDGRLIEEESSWVEYDGPIAECGGGSKTTVQPAAPTAEQTALTQKQVELADFQLEELRRFSTILQQTGGEDRLLNQALLEDAGFRPIFSDESESTAVSPPPASPSATQVPGPIAPAASSAETTRAVISSVLRQFGAPEAAPAAPSPAAPTSAAAPEPTGRGITGFERIPPSAEELRRQEISDELLELELERIRNPGGVTPQQQALIDEAFDRAIAAGEIDIERFQTELNQRIFQEFAPSAGLRPGDTPVLDRAGIVAAEAARQQGQLISGLRGQQAATSLTFPLAQNQLTAQRTQFQQQFGESITQFQEQLRQQAFTNRLNVQGQTGGFGLGLATGIAVPFPGIQQGSTTTTSGGGTLGGLGSLLSGAGAFGSLFSAGSVFGPAAAASSRELKRDPERSESGMRDITHEATLEKLEDLPVERWRYKEGLGLGDRDHVGPYAEDFRETFGIGDGKTINYLDAIGVGLSATKGLAKKVRLLEHATA